MLRIECTFHKKKNISELIEKMKFTIINQLTLKNSNSNFILIFTTNSDSNLNELNVD